jgi:hypothetical protein
MMFLAGVAAGFLLGWLVRRHWDRDVDDLRLSRVASQMRAEYWANMEEAYEQNATGVVGSAEPDKDAEFDSHQTTGYHR